MCQDEKNDKNVYSVACALLCSILVKTCNFDDKSYDCLGDCLCHNLGLVNNGVAKSPKKFLISFFEKSCCYDNRMINKIL